MRELGVYSEELKLLIGIWKGFVCLEVVVLVIHTHSKYEQIAQIWDVLDLSVPGIQLSSLGASCGLQLTWSGCDGEFQNRTAALWR